MEDVIDGITDLFSLFRKATSNNDKGGTNESPAAKTKREADNDGTDEVVFGKKAKLETVSTEEIK